jgi:hypothetical protein
MSQPSRHPLRWAVLLIPAALVALGLFARAAAARSFSSFIGYRPPFTFPPVPQEPAEPLTRRVVMVLIDGLGLRHSRQRPFLDALRARGADFDCRIGLPSLSLPARAVLMTGAWQEIHGQSTNYGARRLSLDHVPRLARARGLATAMAAGEDTLSLFEPDIVHPFVYPKEPETASFEHYEATRQRQIASSRALLAGKQPDFAVLELYITDEAGHGWGSGSAEYARAAALADEAAREVLSPVDLSRDTVVVTADHGHVVSGGHGGPEPDVMHVPLVLAGRGVRPGVTGTCAQVDVAPTLSVLLGLPLPAGSQGRPLLEALEIPSDGRLRALRNAVAQREAFVWRYAGAAPPAGVPALASAADPAGDEARLRARLEALAAAEREARASRQAREAGGRSLPALALFALPPIALLGLFALRLFDTREAGRALAFALLGVAAYHALLPVLGLAYSLTAVNKDEWLEWFFAKDMALGVATCAASAAVLCVWRRRRGATLLELCRLAWLCAAAYTALFVAKVAFIYWRHDVFPRWAMPDQYWAFGFYLDTLVVMAVGLCAPALAAVAALARLVPQAPPASGLATGAAG